MAGSIAKTYANTWQGIVQAAKDAGARYPELVAAQWALESGWGKHFSGKNNPFGIKGKGTEKTTQEVINGKTITIIAEFQDFTDLGESVRYLVDRWYKDWRKYKGVNNADEREAAARSLVTQGYATDPAYAEKLIKIMREKAPISVMARKTIFRMEAVAETWLKKEAKGSTELGNTEKKAVPVGKSYGVSGYTELAANGHAQVELAGGAGTWYVYKPHWKKLLPENEVSNEIDWTDFNARVTKNLTVGEILQWDKRRIPGPHASVQARLIKTAQEFQRIRDAWGKPLGITSFYRPEPINGQVGGVPGSRHTTGDAIDVYPVSGGSLEGFYQWIRPRWTGGLGDGRKRGFIHLDLRNDGHFVPGAGVRPFVEWTY